jgi:signal transduction histidine kinase/ligand-binding sensor domain-containing protein/DNA-binding response OmpR family regulator
LKNINLIKAYRKYFTLFLFLLLITTNLFSQNKFEDFRFLGIKEGISKRAVSSIVQDYYGFMWFGTNGAGLYKYDGVNYETFECDWKKPNSINSNLIYATYVDTSNRLWIGTDEGLCLFDRDLNKFQNIDLKKVFSTTAKYAISVKSIIQDNSGNLLLGTFARGFLKVNLKTLKVSLIKLDVFSSNNYLINSLVKDKKGKIYLGTNLGLKFYESKTNEVKQVILNSNQQIFSDAIESMTFDKQENLWLGTNSNGLVKLSKVQNSFEKLDIPLSKKRIMSLKSANNTILCATENDGLFLVDYNGTVVKNYLNNKFDSNSLKSNSIWSLFTDKENRIWLGYYNKGVDVFDKLHNKFSAIQSLGKNTNSLQISSVTGIAKDNIGQFWVSLEGGGVDIFDVSKKVFKHINSKDKTNYSGLNSDDVQTIFIDSKQNTWLGTWNEGIYFLKKGTKSFVNFNTNNSPNLTSNRILSFSEDSKGRIWIGSFFRGLHYFDSSSNQFFHCDSENFAKNGLNNTNVRKVLVASDDGVWVGTTDGLFKVLDKNNSFSVVSLNNKIPQNIKKHRSNKNILSLFESKDKKIWIGTDGAGLFSYDKKSSYYFCYNDFQGFKEKSVASIEETKDGTIWLSGKTGITKLDLKTQKAINFAIEDGLLVNDFNNNSIFKDANGDLYFGSYEGINYFNPNQLIPNQKENLLYFTDFKLFNKSIEPNEEDSPLPKVISETKNITLDHDQSVFSIDYIDINYSNSGKIEYAYYLEGFEKNWNYVGNKRSATYTNLEPGNYIFKVKSSERGGLWSKNPLELAIKVLPPWWKSIWAYLIYLILILVSAYYLNDFLVNRFKQKQAIQLEREKAVQIEKLNNKKLQFFTNISHEFRTPLTLIINPLEDIIKNRNTDLPDDILNKLQIIHKSSDRLSRLINELMDFNKLQFNKVLLQVQEIEVVSFSQEVVSYFEEEASSRYIKLTFESNATELMHWLDPKMYEKIIFNIVSNAFKVTADYGEIKVVIDAQEKLFLISIQDNGSGLDKKEVKKIFDRFYQVNNLNKTYYGSTGIGLEVVRGFVDLHKGKIEVESELGIGTKFIISFPLGKNLFSESEIATEKQQSKSVVKPAPSLATGSIIEEGILQERIHTILIVEDNTELRNYLKEELKKHYKVLVAENGKKGWELASEKLPDLILTDVIMPVMNGLELCKKIKGDVKTSHIPLLMLSAKTMVQDKLEGIDCGADMYLSKPFDMDILKSSLIQLISSRQIMFNKFYSGITKNTKEKTTTLDNDFIQKTLSFINQNINESELSVEVLASKVFLSRSQLYRKIKTLTGVSVNEFIRNVRLEKAKQLIEMGNNNINEISYKVGFTSPSYFTKCFKTKFGYLPTQTSNHGIGES